MHRLVFVFTIVAFFVQFMANGQDTISTKPKISQEKKPKVALVLSGGGAKGVAHLPTLQALDSLGIVPDLIIGNSMGSIMGALYAMGYTGDSIVNVVKQANWTKLMGGGVSLKDVSAEEKAEYQRYIIELDLEHRKLKIGNSLLNDQNLREFITILTFPVYDVNDFDDLPIPFRAVATDIVHGEEVILGSGSLALAMRASMSIPGVFQAVPYNGTLLVDGGLLNNFPVDIAKNMGADIIIGSDVGMQAFTKERLENLSSLLMQTTMLNSNLKRPKNRELCDILIDHSKNITYSTGDFKSALEIYEQGKGAVQQKMDTLTALANILNKYEQRQVKLPAAIDEFSMDTVTYSGISENNLALVKARTNIKVDTPSNIEDVIGGVNRAMGTTLFKQIAYNLVINEDEVALELQGVERSPHQIKGALHYDRYHGIGIIGNYTGRNILGNASRILVTADIAEQPKLRLQYQKNFGYERNWWWRNEFYGQQLKQKVFLQGTYVDNVRNRYHAIDNQFNRNLSPLRSYVGFGVKYHNTNIKPTIDPKLNESIFKFSRYNNYDVEVYAQYNYNSMNKVHFATHGRILKGSIGRSLSSYLKVDFTDPTIPDIDGTADGFSRFGYDQENRFLITERIAAIIGTSAHFILEDSDRDEETSFSSMALNSKYFLGGNVSTARNEFYLFPGLQEEELLVSQFVRLKLGMQINLLNNIYITPHADIASVAFGDFRDYVANVFKSNGNWSDFTDPSILISAGTTFSYSSILGPVNFDLSWVNDIDKVRFSIGIGLHLNSSN